jgi:pullulanase
MAWTRDAFLDLLRIRASTPLLRLPDAAAIEQRLSFAGTGPGQPGTVVAVHLDGAGLDGAGFAAVAYLVNAGTEAVAVTMPQAAGRAFRLHPVQAAATAADPRPREDARFTSASGTFTVPARTAVVYVLD